MVMYLFGWISLVIISMWISVAAFLWAFRSGQFSEQERARYLPLYNESTAPPEHVPRGFTAETRALLAIGIIGLGALLSPIVLLIFRIGGKG
ncbi:MAG: cbb3-type cytochrome oxidase assembly protein CcoS [Syntrophobacteraceae bacterium]|jgi:cbb3-type cytochrome oxidase maturation protein|nr:cbb3-type cytochrome oxidase assembly protein CcoS [Syntrophobacteraceae bacterium]